VEEEEHPRIGVITLVFMVEEEVVALVLVLVLVVVVDVDVVEVEVDDVVVEREVKDKEDGFEEVMGGDGDTPTLTFE